MKKEIGHSSSSDSHWLISKWVDLTLLILPVWIVWIFFFSNASYFESIEMPLWTWVLFIVCFDVSHVWSSVFRSYFVKDEFQAHRFWFLIIPLIVFSLSLLVLSFSIEWFWRVMAYLAVFHFIRQQYGFTALYKLRCGEKRKQLIRDKWIIYFATLVPVVYWHLNSTAKFSWFVAGDFFRIPEGFNTTLSSDVLSLIFSVGYWLIIILWLVQELLAMKSGARVSVGKILWILTTALNWWLGIVYFNSDLIFSVSNVIAHGLPYIVLIHFYTVKKEEIVHDRRLKLGAKIRWLLIIVFTILVAAFIEEYLWDMWVYREHTEFFEAIYPYYSPPAESWFLMLAMALLALPQQVHYVLDGIIWKFNTKNSYFKKIFISEK